MKDAAIDAKNQRMLELLAQGATSRVMARQMGYQEGTMRVYLHNLYRRIGVANKTEAVVWYLNRERSREDVKAVESAQRVASGDLVGDMALEEDLFTALGVMSQFLGPYGRVWEVAQKIEGNDIEPSLQERRARVRMMWRALLKGDWAYGKRLYDSDLAAQLAMDAPADGVFLGALLIGGGYTLAADRFIAQLTDKRKATRGLSARDAALLRNLREAFNSRDDEHALSSLQKAAHDKAVSTQRQLAQVMWFNVLKARGDLSRARQAANAVWSEAEGARKHLEAMGERPFASTDAATPVRASAREKAAATR